MKLSFVGDVCVRGELAVDPWFDQLVPNLECAPYLPEYCGTGKVSVQGYESTIRALRAARLAGVCIANNHIVDGGGPGINSVLSDLASARLPFVGYDGSELRISVAGLDVAILAYVCESTVPSRAVLDACGINVLSTERVLEDMSVCVADHLRPIVLLHWGAEEVSWPSNCQIVLARNLIDCGAEAVIGHHQHVVLPWERYRGKVIAYGVGNFAFDDVVGVIGTPSGTKQFAKKQAPWNRKGAAVVFGDDGFAPKVVSTAFDSVQRTVRHVGQIPETKVEIALGHSKRRRGAVAAMELLRVRAYQFMNLPIEKKVDKCLARLSGRRV